MYEGLIKFNLESALTLQNYINNLLHCQLKAVNMYMLSQKFNLRSSIYVELKVFIHPESNPDWQVWENLELLN